MKRNNNNNSNNLNDQAVARIVLENNLPCFINERGNLFLVLPSGERVNPLFTDKLVWLKRVAYSVGISPKKIEKLIKDLETKTSTTNSR